MLCDRARVLARSDRPETMTKSNAGMIITGVAEKMEKSISSFVMLDAFFPETGEAPVDLQLNGYTFSRIVVCHLADLTRASRPAPCQGRSVRRSA